jgi:hypothetical protein
VIWATTGSRARSGSHRGQTKDSHRDDNSTAYLVLGSMGIVH